MAVSKKNIIIEGLSGKIGNLVFRRRKTDGKVFVAVPPSPHRTAPTGEKKRMNDKFKRAVLYGKSVIANPATKALYAQSISGGQTAFNLAVADFLNAPVIEEIDVSSYTGKAGSVIRIKATDNFKVASVLVKIADADGTQIEVGEAVMDKGDELYWHYIAAEDNNRVVGSRVIVTASDMPRNETVQEKIV
jgi:hypothetical protein